MEEVIVEDLLDKIIRGTFTAGELLPSENVLSRRFNVPRMMVRSAYNHLEARGYIRSIRGKGRFLSPPKRNVPLDLRSDISFTEKVKAMGADLTTHNLGTNPVDYSKKIWTVLGAEKKERIFSVSLLRVIAGEPIAIHTSFIRERLFPGITEIGDEITSMYSFFSERGYAGFDSTNTTMNVTLPTLAEQVSLGCPSLVPLLLLEYETIAGGTEVIQFNKVIYRGDRFKYRI